MTLAGIVIIMLLAIIFGTRSREYRMKQMVIIILLTLVQVGWVAWSLYSEDKIPQLRQSSTEGTP
jgi:predicted RNase H-related nuclease YkuK (DUF458 family)